MYFIFFCYNIKFVVYLKLLFYKIKIIMNFSKIKFIHNIPNAPNVNIWVDNAPLISKVAYKTISPYICMAPGEHILQVYTESETKTPLFDYDIKLEDHKDYTIIMTGDLTDRNNLHITVYDDLVQAPGTGNTAIRFINGVIGTTAIDIYNKNIKILSNVGFDTESPYINFNPSETTFLAITNNNSLNVLLGPIKLNFASGDIYTLIITGTANNLQFPMKILLSNDTASMCITL